MWVVGLRKNAKIQVMRNSTNKLNHAKDTSKLALFNHKIGISRLPRHFCEMGSKLKNAIKKNNKSAEIYSEFWWICCYWWDGTWWKLISVSEKVSTFRFHSRPLTSLVANFFVIPKFGFSEFFFVAIISKQEMLFWTSKTKSWLWRGSHLRSFLHFASRV